MRQRRAGDAPALLSPLTQAKPTCLLPSRPRGRLHFLRLLGTDNKHGLVPELRRCPRRRRRRRPPLPRLNSRGPMPSVSRLRSRTLRQGLDGRASAAADPESPVTAAGQPPRNVGPKTPHP